MCLLNASGSDGFHVYFFLSQWDITGNVVYEWVQVVFAGNNIDPKLNKTHDHVYSKKDSIEKFSQFFPIRMCSVMYKLVMKVIANRLKLFFPNFILQEQVDFIVGCNISDNFIIAQEVIHSIKEKVRW